MLLLEALENSDQEWKDNFRSEWWTLEQVYAVACDRKESHFSSESQALIDETIENIKALLSSRT